MKIAQIQTRIIFRLMNIDWLNFSEQTANSRDLVNSVRLMAEEPRLRMCLKHVCYHAQNNANYLLQIHCNKLNKIYNIPNYLKPLAALELWQNTR